jgi:two-component system chemotaxis response regulator CheY
MRILIIDDDHVCCLLLATMLKPYGDCRLAKDGETAISLFTEALLRQQPYDLVCLDIQMPGLDGQVTLRCLRAIEAGCGRTGRAGATILMASVQDNPKSILSAFRGQCEGYLIKPLDPAQLIAQLTSLGIKPGNVAPA